MNEKLCVCVCARGGLLYITSMLVCVCVCIWTLNFSPHNALISFT